MDAGDVLICAPRRASRERVCHGVPISTETRAPGAAVHCNMLHHSPANLSDAPSSRLLCAFNARSNPVPRTARKTKHKVRLDAPARNDTQR